jgi:hypothetical protein
MQLLLDTKPRFRAEHIAWGPFNRFRRKAGHLYTSWVAGPTLPRSVVADMYSDDPFTGLWNKKRNPGEIVILQSGEADDWKRMNELAHEFVKKQVKGRERLLIVDEGMDFYHRNTMGLDAKKDVILRTARAGAERNIGLMFGAHRPYGIPPLLNTLSSHAAIFHLRYEGDMKYLSDMGIKNDERPEEDFVFNYYTIRPGGKVSTKREIRLTLPQWYLDELSKT